MLVLVPFIPADFAINYSAHGHALVFATNFVAILPSIERLMFAVSEMQPQIGWIRSALISMTFRYVLRALWREVGNGRKSTLSSF